MARLGRDAFASLGNYRRAMLDWLENPGVATRVATTDGAVAGFVMVAVLDDGEGRHGYVLAIGVGDAHRQRGLGRQLLDLGLEVLDEEHERLAFSEVRATVAEDNAPAQRLFRSAGFTVQDQTHAIYPGGQRALTVCRAIP